MNHQTLLQENRALGNHLNPEINVMEIVMLIGIPATGKSSFYQNRFAASHLRINRDMLKTATRTSSLFEWCLERKQSCVIDNTNTTRAVRRGWISPAREKGVPVIGYFFESKLEGALMRNSQREGAARIRDAGVRYHHDQLELPSLDEGFSSLFFVKLLEDGFNVETWNHEI